MAGASWSSGLRSSYSSSETLISKLPFTYIILVLFTELSVVRFLVGLNNKNLESDIKGKNRKIREAG